MGKILVSGLINIETTLQVDGFPIQYSPVRYPFFGVNSTVSGVGYNIAKALTVLGDQVEFLSLVGSDLAGEQVLAALKAERIPHERVIRGIEHTAQSVILYDPGGRRQIHVDLKDIQERDYHPDRFDDAVGDCSLAVLCNINFSRPLLKKARQAGKWIATDVHTIASLEDAYNRDFMAAADILFLSDEALPTSPDRFSRDLIDRYANEIVVIGLGERGALLAVKRDGFCERIPAAYTRPVVNTIGAGDALFSSFLHFYIQRRDPYEAIQKAVVFASYKTGESGAAQGFLPESELERLMEGKAEKDR